LPNIRIPHRDLVPEPPRAADERHTLVTFVDYFRSVLLRQAAGLAPEQLGSRLGPSPLTLGGLIKHMALVEDSWFHMRWADNDPPAPWDSVDWDATPDWDFDSAGDDQPGELEAMYLAAIARSDAVIASAALDDTMDAPSGPTSMRWILVHMIEEYARHCGHADLLRESIDGRTGD
jgi:hypothetical protein